MKILLLEIFLLIPILSFGQKQRIPEILWQGRSDTEIAYLDLLEIKDRNALFVKIGFTGDWKNGQTSVLIVYQNDGNVRRFVIHHENSAEVKMQIKKKRIKRKHYPNYWAHLEKCASNNSFQIDTVQLNIMEKKLENGSIETMEIVPGTTYQFQITQGNNYISYKIYSPNSYISRNYSGSVEKQKFVDLIEGFQRLLATN